MGWDHGGRRLKWGSVHDTLLIGIAKGHELTTLCQKRWGVIGGKFDESCR